MNPAERNPTVPVAIIGMGCLFPKAGGLGRYWANLRDGVDAIREIPAGSHWDPADYHDADPKAPDRTYARRGGFLDPVDFPALDFGIAPANLEATDTTQLLGLAVAKAALDDAGYTPGGKPLDRDRVSVILGVTGTLELVIPLGARLGHPIWRRALKDAGVAEPVASDVVRRISDSYVGWQENSFPGLLGNVAAGRIANRLDLGGTNCVVDAACASSLGAVHLALMELASGRCDVALSGGLDTFNDIFMYMCFSKTPALSPSGDARPFSSLGDGTALGEGLGVLTLKRLDDARRDGDRIYAVIRAMGSSSDGKGNAVYAPSAAGQAKCLRRAYAEAGFGPETVGLVEGHGTGTKVGDAVELSALVDVFRSAKPEGTWCGLGSVKSQIGHTKAAAGAAGLIKAALALHHKVLPATIKVDGRPADLALPGASPFYLNTEARPWLPSEGHPRRAGVSAFGFGGTNFHCVLEEAGPGPAPVAWDGDDQVVAFSGPTPGAIRAGLGAWPAGLDWDAFRLEAARSRSRFDPAEPCRLAIVAHREGTPWDRLAERARALLASDSSPAVDPEGIYYGAGAGPGGLAVLFPGQGSQYVGMLRDLAVRFPAMLDALAHADAAAPGLGDRVYPRPSYEEEGRKAADRALRSTDVAQPAIGAVSLGAYRVLGAFGLRPDAFAGHSFGELTALHAAGRIDAPAFFDLARLRGRLMAGGGGDRGGMIAAMAPAEAIEAVVREENLDLVLANRNAPRQSVLSGPTAEVARAAEAFGRRGISTRVLEVAAAFHSRLVADASGPLGVALAAVDLRASAAPVYANSTAEAYPADPGPARSLLAGQLARPVRFVEQVEAMARSGIRTFLEVGPDSKLTALVDAILEGRPHASLALDSSRGRRPGMADLARTLAHLAALGHPIKLAAWDEGAEALAPIARKPGLTVKVSGANFAPKPVARPAAPEENGSAEQADPARRPPAVGQASVLAPAGSSPQHPTEPARPATPAAPRITATPAPEPRPTMSTTPPPADRPTSRPAPTPAVAALVEHRPGRNGTSPAPTPPAAPSFLADAIRTSQENLVALQRLGEQTAHVHRRYLEGQDRAAETFQALLDHQQRLTLAAIGMAPASMPMPMPQVALAAPAPAPAPVIPRPRPEPVAPTVQAPRPRSAAPAPAPEPAPAAVAKQAEPAPTPRPAPVAAAPSVLAVLAEVVAEKTGYPAEVLEPSMQLDADLGIDSIKRVEILAALQERLPSAPVIGPEHLGTIRTLGQIVEFLGGRSEAPATTAPTPVAAPAADDIHRALAEVVAEKTGYPAEVLEPGMQLDADLGIDSIKRVEILAALQERLPMAPVIGPEHLGTIRTLGQIAEFLGGRPGSAPASTPAPAPAPARSAIADVQRALVEVVAEKTGYPAEVLEPGMQLDADLGIDSIKRVEILSALQERLPSAPVIGPEHLGTIRTLGQIAEFLGGGEAIDSPPVIRGREATPAPTKAGPPEPSSSGVDREPVRRLIPEVTGLGDPDRRERIDLAGGEVWVLDDGTDLPSAVLARLAAAGLRGRPVGIGEAGRLPAPARLAGLILIAPATGKLAVGPAFGLLRLAAPALRSAGSASFATVTRLGGSFGLGGIAGGSDPASGALAGLAKTAGHEWPEVACKAIDLDPGLPAAEAALAIVEEFTTLGPAEVGVSPGGRAGIALRAEAVAAPSGVGPIAPGDLIVITGGARGVTAEVAVALASAFRPTVAILGRSPAPTAEPDWLAPLEDEAAIKRALHSRGAGATIAGLGEEYRKVAANREVLANLDRIGAAGAKVAYRSVDVRDAGAVRSVVAGLRAESGPVRGLVHGAGVLADRRIEDQADDQFARVFETKVGGLDALLGAIGGDDLKALVLFSSTTARFGRVGQVAYAAANEALNKRGAAEAVARPGCRVVSVNWGPWDGGMVTPSLRPLFEAEGIPLIPTAEGARYLVEELRSGAKGPVEVVILGGGGPEPAFLRAAAVDETPDATMAKVFERVLDAETTPILRSHVMDGRPVLPMALILEWLAQGAMTRHPGLACLGVDDLRLLKGVVLRDAKAETIRVLAGKAQRRDGLTYVPVELRGDIADGREVLHARAEVVLGERHAEGGRPAEEPSLPPYAGTTREIYRDILFHGPGLQGIGRVEGCGEGGIVATVEAAPSPSAWIEKPLRQQWLTDPLALDGAFQMMILWSFERSGAGSLPTFVGRYRQFRRAYPAGGVRVVARVTESSPHRARADVDFLDAAGDLVARIEDYECVIDASLKSAFRRNRASVESK